MMYIPFGDCYTAKVNDSMYDVLNSISWRAQVTPHTVYAIKKINKRTEYMHWWVAGYPIRGYVTDHKNSDGSDNRSCNVRTITVRQNIANRACRQTSWFPGISWNPADRQWKTNITINGKRIHLGHFNSSLEAFIVYRNAIISVGEELLPEHEKMFVEAIARNKTNPQEILKNCAYSWTKQAFAAVRNEINTMAAATAA